MLDLLDEEESVTVKYVYGSIRNVFLCIDDVVSYVVVCAC